MATNYVQKGVDVTVAAPTGGVSSGDPVLIGKLFGIAATDAAEGEDVVLHTEGVFTVSKTSALAIDVGDRLFFVPGSGVVNKTAASQVCVGIAVTSAANPSPTVEMKLVASTPTGT